MPSQLVIISGPPHAGKSAAAEALCQRYDRMLHIEMDALHGLLRMGRLRSDDESQEADRQRRLFIEAACDMASRFLDAGYGVVIDDVVTEDQLSYYRERLAGSAALAHFVVLLPSLAVLESRAHSVRTAEQYARFAAWSGVCVIDPGDAAPELVADRVMAAAAQGVALL